MRKRVLFGVIFSMIFAGVISYVSQNWLTVEVETLASYEQDNNNGYFLVDFLNNQSGIAAEGSLERDNINVDTQVGVAELADDTQPGYFTTVEIRPVSFRKWEEIEIVGNFASGDDVAVSLYDCGEPNPSPIPPGDLPEMALIGGRIDIGLLNKESYACIRVRVDLNNGTGIAPIVDDVKITWTKLPVFLISESVTSEVLSGDNITYVINYSSSYADDSNVVIWSRVPTVGNGGISNYTVGFGQDLGVMFESASNGGQYTESDVSLYGVTVPAGSVYWVMANIEAGKSGIVTYTLDTNNGIESGVRYITNAYMDSELGDVKESNTVTSEIRSQAYPEIEKSMSGTLNVGGKQYVYNGEGYVPVVNYSLQLGNAYIPYRSRGVEEIFNPVVTDDLGEIISTLEDSCGVPEVEISSRIDVNDDGILDVSAGNITWALISGIRPGEIEYVSYSVDYSGCPDSLEINNTAQLEGYNIASVESSAKVPIGLDLTPSVVFARGDIVDGGDGTDGMVTDFRVRFNQGLPSPANFVGESGQFDGLVSTVEQTDDYLQISKEALFRQDFFKEAIETSKWFR